MLTHKTYYRLKPLIPKPLQIMLRRKWVLWKRKRYQDIWPIDEKANRPPEGWTGWPGGKKFALVLTHDVESPRGVERCIELAKLEERLGLRSSFNFVAEDYHVPGEVFNYLKEKGFEIGIHGIHHDGNIFGSYRHFQKQVAKINHYLKKWEAGGFRAPSMYHKMKWVGELNIEYDASTFDTDPFEPQPDGVGTIFPFWVSRNDLPPTSNLQPQTAKLEHPPPTSNLEPPTAFRAGFVELPYTLPQDHTLFVLMKERNINIWKEKLDWIVKQGGMALLITHPDYMKFDPGKSALWEYRVSHYLEFLEYVRERYCDLYWNVLPKNVASFFEKGRKKDPTHSR
jgi:peptidoglycan/xylan/chitin deacetylase (PgdA/CDA1 family)